MIPKNNIARILLVTALMLSIPLIAMQFSDEVDWRLPDFIIIGALFIGTGLIYDFAIKRVQNTGHRFLIAVVIISVFLLIWTHLAVGIIDDAPFAGS